MGLREPFHYNTITTELVQKAGLQKYLSSSQIEDFVPLTGQPSQSNSFNTGKWKYMKWKSRWGVVVTKTPPDRRCGRCQHFPGNPGKCKEANGRRVYAMDYPCDRFKS